MPDEYWIIVKGPRFDRFPVKWLSKTHLFYKYCEYDALKGFIEKLREDCPGWIINIGVTREQGIYIIG